MLGWLEWFFRARREAPPPPAAKPPMEVKWYGTYGPFRAMDGNRLPFHIWVGADVLEFCANIDVEGDVLKFSGIWLYKCAARDAKLDLGASVVMRVRQLFIDKARGEGFRQLILSGERTSGSAPGRQVEVTIAIDSGEVDDSA